MTHIYAIQCLHKIWYLEMGGGHLFNIVQREKSKNNNNNKNRQTNKTTSILYFHGVGEYLVNQLS